MAEQRDAAAEPASVDARAGEGPTVDARPRMPAAFATALAGAAVLIGTVVTIVIVVNATTG